MVMACNCLNKAECFLKTTFLPSHFLLLLLLSDGGRHCGKTVPIFGTGLDYNDGQFFRAMEWLMVFFQATIDFNGFDNVGPSPLNVFFMAQPLESMVF